MGKDETETSVFLSVLVGGSGLGARTGGYRWVLEW